MADEKVPRWRNRIVGEAVVPAIELQAMLNAKNWRTHSEDQKDAITAVLDEVGWVQDVIVNRTTGHVVDGHLRIERAFKHGESVPVKYVELTEEEEDMILAVFDPIAAMAGVDIKAFDELAASIETDSLILQQLLDTIADGKKSRDKKNPPELQLPESQYLVLVTCKSEVDQVELLADLTGKGMSCRALVS